MTTSSIFNNNNLINIDNVVPYLLEHKLINVKSIVDGDLQIFDISRKNRNIRLMRKNNTSLLLKQSIQNDISSSIALKREALLYALMQNDENFSALVDITPRIHDFDEDKNILITEFVKGYSWNEYVYSSKNLAIEEKNVSILGKILATYHNAFEKMIFSQKLKFLPKTFSFEQLLIHPGPEIFSNLSQANLKLLKIIQKDPKIYDLLEEIFSNWNSQTLIHGDLKFDNIIISLNEEKDIESANKTLLVDWELANIGDPAWDVGSIFQEFIRTWLSLLPITGTESAEELINLSKESFQNMQKSLRLFWNSYCKVVDKSAKEINELLVRATKLSAARLIQSAYEMLHSQIDLNNLEVYMVQISLNILNNINNAIIHLLGIPFRFDF